MRKLLLYDLEIPDHLDLFEFADLRTIDSIDLSNDLNSGLRHWVATASTNDYAIFKLTSENAIKVATMLPRLCEYALFVAIYDCQENPEISKFLTEYHSCFCSKEMQSIKNKIKEVAGSTEQ